MMGQRPVAEEAVVEPDAALHDHPRAASAAQPLFSLLGGYVASLALAVLVHGMRPGAWLSQFSAGWADRARFGDGSWSEPVIGRHHFGDWQEILFWARFPNPYIEPEIGTHLLPPGLLAIKAIVSLPVLWSWLLLVLVSAGVTFGATNLILRRLPLWQRLLAWLLAFGFSAGFLCAADRGSLHALAIGLVGFWVVAGRLRRTVVAAVLLTAAAMFKPYLLILLVWPLVQKRWKEVGATLGVAVAGTLVGFLLLPGSAADTLAGYYETSRIYSSAEAAPELYLRTTSMFGLMTHPVSLITHDWAMAYLWATSFPGWVRLLPGLVWLGMVTHLATRRQLSEAVRLTFVLSLTQFVIPTTQTYTTIWAGLAVVLLLADPDRRDDPLIRGTVWAALGLTVIPIALTFGGVVGPPVASALTPLAWLASGAISIGRARSIGTAAIPMGAEAVTDAEICVRRSCSVPEVSLPGER